LNLLVDSARGGNDPTAVKQDSSSFPDFDIHVGAGILAGGRFGTRVQVSRHFSLEGSIGYDLRNL